MYRSHSKYFKIQKKIKKFEDQYSFIQGTSVRGNRVVQGLFVLWDHGRTMLGPCWGHDLLPN